MKIFKTTLLLMMISIFVVAELSADATGVKSVKQGKGQITGRLLEYESSKPVAGYQVCLYSPKSAGTPAGWEDVKDLKIEATTSKDGMFKFDKVGPGRYIFMLKFKISKVNPEVGYANIRYENAKIIEVKLTRDQVVDLGKVWTQLP